MQKQPMTRNVLCDLTGDERRQKGIELATTIGDISTVEAERKATNDHYKDRIGGLQATADELGRKVRDGKEWRKIECEIVYSQPDKAHKQIVRCDTREVVATEIMTTEDLQLVIPLVETVAPDEVLPPEKPKGKKASENRRKKTAEPMVVVDVKHVTDDPAPQGDDVVYDSSTDETLKTDPVDQPSPEDY